MCAKSVKEEEYEEDICRSKDSERQRGEAVRRQPRDGFHAAGLFTFDSFRDDVAGAQQLTASVHRLKLLYRNLT